MHIEKAIKILHQHNLWRRGAEIEPFSPSVIGEAIDTVVDHYMMRKTAQNANRYEGEGICILIGQDEEDYFISVPQTSCCHAGPITNENYCPKCGAKIERDV